jgi:hypothetical protein
MIETKIQTEDLASRLQDAVMRAAMPTDEEIAVLSGAKRIGNEKKQSVSPRSGAPTPAGRPVGVRNKLTNLRDAVLEAFDQVGGAQYLAKLAQGTTSDRAAFVGLVAKVLPTQVNATVDGGIQVHLSWLGARNIGQTQVVDLERQVNGRFAIAGSELHTITPQPSIDAACEAEGGQSAYKSTHNGEADGAGGGSMAGKDAGGAQGA